VPAIQISCAADGKRTDIDVDYRSSKFPVAILNGHLSSANSDVRAGNNHARHCQPVDRFRQLVEEHLRRAAQGSGSQR
jgi:hypothetical protein